MNWHNAANIDSRTYKCGHCGSPLASQMGYIAKGNRNNTNRTK